MDILFIGTGIQTSCPLSRSIKVYTKLLDKPVVYFDVDSTLVFAPADCPKHLQHTGTWVGIGKHTFRIHSKHVLKVKEFWARGHTVVIWSAGGSDWGEMVVKALQLEDYVHYIAPKPYWYCDDLSAEKWMDGRRFYLDEE
jgi:hypothetical protein